MIRKILVATDFSETSEGAVKWAGEISQAHDAELRVLHGLRLASHITPYVPPPPDLDQELQRQVAARLEETAEALRKLDREVSVRLRNEVPSEAIRAEAEDWGADLVVMGTKGLSGVEHLLLGSTAERVIGLAPCPVLSVHPGDFDRHRPLRKILVPTDFSDEARQSAEAAVELLGDRQQGELILVHAYHMPVEYTAYGAVPTTWDFMKEIADSAEKELQSWAGELTGRGWAVSTRVSEGPPSVVIQRLAEEEGVDLIAMGTHGRGGLASFLLGSNSRKVVQHAPCPVLTVRHHE